MRRSVCALLAVLASGLPVLAQSVVSSGAGSYASMPPAYKAATDEHSGFNATRMLSRKLYVDELPSTSRDGIEVPGRPLPTNDWWTDVLASRYSGSLWSYPSMLRTSEDGVQINYPTYWADAGKEIKSRTNLTVGALRWKADATIAADWHDWDVVLRMPDAAGTGEMRVTAAHGSPFTWFEFSGLTPEIRFSQAPELFAESTACAGIRIGADLYGIYFPAGVHLRLVDGAMQPDADCPWLVVALLRSESDLQTFAPYATSIPRSTSVSWSFDESTSRLATFWTVIAENLRNPDAEAPVMQGFLPHAYKYALPGANLNFDGGPAYLTPRGQMKMAVSPTGEFSYSYPFSGMLPSYAAPVEGNAPVDGYDPTIMRELMQSYASAGSFGGDTYWGGKGLTQMALNMMFAKETGHTDIYETSRTRLREAFENWLTYTPGENTFFFSYYPRWGAMLGFDVSYDSDAFNDHHFHYGYFTYAAALLCLEDPDFAANYAEILTLIAKDYANWDKDDTRFPFLRTLDPWCGHSWAGGMGDAGNDNGNGQESTSEAMQGWGGIYLLGVALGNREMRDAGLFGWSTEARATREYWYDVDSPRPANAGGRKPWPGKGDRSGNYDYNEYPYAYNSNITGKGIGWWTWFGGDPLFMHGIQWMPVSPALDYLSWDTDFVAWAYDDMMSGANSAYSHKWFEPTVNTDSGETIEPLALNDWGNVTLSYLQRADPQQAASIFARAWRENLHIAKAVSTGHISYYVTHSHLTWGEPDFGISADIPTAQAYVKDRNQIFMVYNPGHTDRTVRFTDASGALVRSVQAPPRRLTVFTGPARPESIDASSSEGRILPPGSSTLISSRILDQYGAAIAGEPVVLSLPDGVPATLEGSRLSVPADAPRGSVFALTLRSGDITATLGFTVNDRPQVQSVRIEGLPAMLEVGTPLSLALHTVDQYGVDTEVSDARWTITDDSGNTTPVSATFTPSRVGNFTLTAYTADASASAATFITPPMPLVSAGAIPVGSSAENAGCLPEFVNDGNLSTRWGSAHTDDQWIMLDLGADCFISRVLINWEAAYAAAYDIEIAPDGCVMTTHTGDFAGQQRTVSLPADGEWTSVTPETAAGPGNRETAIGARGRYVRVHGRRRATAWGYSIHEMTVYGLGASLGPDDVLGIDFALPQVADQHATLILAPRAYTLSGEKRDISVHWSADKPAEFAGNRFIPRSYGLYTVTATAPGGIATSAYTFINEAERIAGIELSASDLTIIEGESAVLTATLLNQFGAPCRMADADIDIAVTDSGGIPTDLATYDPATGIFASSAPGVYTVRFGSLASAKISVVPLRDANLALGKPAAASSVRDGNKASFVNDGNTSTRWESDWADDQWIAIDLLDKYEIDRMEILWEGAFARQYRIQASTDGSNWTEIYSAANAPGGTEKIAFQPVAASHVRINCDRRALEAYGFSIYEWRVYGLRRIADTSGVENITLDSSSEMYFDLQGRRLPTTPARGFYIVPGRSVYYKN
ncbi:MAG: discoidin domain-containing protein [Muribaculaceae bacterium]|nr:discoidin domain-containing protein [Muribaculaceae bacterium]